MAGENCYWFNQGKCFLFIMEPGMVFSILAKSPKARKDMLNCGLKCPDVDLAFLEFASNPETLVESQQEMNEAHMNRINRYKDYHRHVDANPTLPKAQEEEDEE